MANHTDLKKLAHEDSRKRPTTISHFKYLKSIKFFI